MTLICSTSSFLLRAALSAVLAWTPLLSAAQLAQGQPQRGLPTTEIRLGMFLIQAMVASSPQQREIGLMHRRDLGSHEGMLFVFERAGVQCFWMKNTLIPLTAAFIADDGRIVNMADMEPLSLASHCSAEPVRYVLEMNQGWFAQKRVQRGAQLTGRIFQR
jgi:uncharacterized membrane protein (UPF0127 family)